MAADTRIKADTVDDLLSIQTLTLCIGVQLIEVSNAQCQISIGEQFDCLSLSETHEQGIDILLDSTFLQQASKLMCCLYQSFVSQIDTNDDTGRIQVIPMSPTP